MALLADYNRPRATGEDRLAYPVEANTLIRRGAGLCRNAAGRLVPAGDVAGYRTAGVAYRYGLDNLGGDAGTDTERTLDADMSTFLFRVVTEDGGGALLPIQPAQGKPGYWIDDDTLTADPGFTNNAVLGCIFERVDEATGLWLCNFRISLWIDTLNVLIQDAIAAPATLTAFQAALAPQVEATQAETTPKTKTPTKKTAAKGKTPGDVAEKGAE